VKQDSEASQNTSVTGLNTYGFYKAFINKVRYAKALVYFLQNLCKTFIWKLGCMFWNSVGHTLEETETFVLVLKRAEKSLKLPQILKTWNLWNCVEC